MEASIGLGSVFPPNFTVNNILGCSTRFNSTKVIRNKTTKREILIPPEVEPAQPPVKYKMTRANFAMVGHCS